MADLTQELALLNKQAAELLKKYDQAFTRLDEKSQELAEQLVNQINEGLSQLRSLQTSGETTLQQKIDDGVSQLVAKIQEGLNQLQTIIETGAFPRVVSKPTIAGSTTVAISHQTSWTVKAESYLDEKVHIDRFEIRWGDGKSETVSATGNQATISHTFSGSPGDTFQISVVAVDSLGNKSEPATLQIQLVDNRPPTAPQIDAPSQIIQGETGKIKLYGSTDPDGDPVTYKIVDKGLFTFSKTENIAENEEVQITVSVESDTSSIIKAVAVDDKGLMSPITNFEILIKKVRYGVADIFGDGSIVSYLPLKQNFEDLTGNLKYTFECLFGTPAFDEDLGYYLQGATQNDCRSRGGSHLYISGGPLAQDKNTATPYKFVNLGTEYTLSAQLKIRFNSPFTILQAGNYGEGECLSPADLIDFRTGSENMYFGVGGKTDSSQSTICRGYNWSVYKEFPISLGIFHTVTVVRDNLYIALFRDGTKLWEHTFEDESINTDMHLYAIFGNSGQCWGYSGYLRNVRIFNRALSEAEIRILANEN